MLVYVYVLLISMWFRIDSSYISRQSTAYRVAKYVDYNRIRRMKNACWEGIPSNFAFRSRTAEDPVFLICDIGSLCNRILMIPRKEMSSFSRNTVSGFYCTFRQLKTTRFLEISGSAHRVTIYLSQKKRVLKTPLSYCTYRILTLNSTTSSNKLHKEVERSGI